MAPIVSVVTVCKDDRQGVLTTNSSFTAQKCSEAEQIIVVAPSNDGSHVAAAALKGDSVRVLVQHPIGIFPAMNLGWREASGEWIVFLNAGDRFADGDALGRAIGFLTSIDLTTQSVLFAGFIRNGKEVRLVQPRGEVSKSRFAYGRLRTIHGSIAVRRSLIQQLGGFREDLRIASDYDLILRALERGGTVSRIPLTEFNVGGVSTTNIRLSLWEARLSRRDHFLASVWARMLDDVWYAYRLTRHIAKVRLRACEKLLKKVCL